VSNNNDDDNGRLGDLGLVAGGLKIVVWSSSSSSSSAGFRGLSVDKTHIAEAYFKLHAEEDDSCGASFSAVGRNNI
jgi:hypothetical protein